MKLFRPICILLFFIILSGCSSLLTTERALIDKNIATNFCSNQNFVQLTNKIHQRMNKCYGGNRSQGHYVNGAVFTTNISNQVSKKVNANGVVSFAYSVQPALNPTYFHYRVQLENTKQSSCPVLITTHVVNQVWKKHSLNLERWINGENIECQR